MKFRRVLVLVMTFAMLVSAFVPTLSVVASGVDNGGHEHESGKKHYVSIGDSMANGYGFEGYLQGKEGHDFFNGIGTYGAGAYPLQFEEYLKDIYGENNVEHTKLSLSALTPEFLLYFLGGREYLDSPWHEGVLDYAGSEDANGNDLPADANAMCDYFQNAVKDADIITLGIGNGSFGAFLLSEVTDVIGIMGSSSSVDPRYTLENALSILESEEDKAKIIEVYNSVMADLLAAVPADLAEAYHLEDIANVAAFTTAGYIVNFAKSIDRIVELNEKENLEIILVGLMNTTYGMTITLDENTSISFGDIMDNVFGILNDYMAAYPAVQQARGELQGAKFCYAEQPNPLFIVQALDDLAANNWQNIDNGRLSADIVRSRTIDTFNGALLPMISAGFVAGINAGIKANVLAEFRSGFGIGSDVMSDDQFIEFMRVNSPTHYSSYVDTLNSMLLPDGYALLPEISLDDVKQYEANTPASWSTPYFWTDNADRKNLSVAVYLGIEDAIVESVELEEIPLGGLITIATNIMSAFEGFNPDISAPETVHNTVGAFFSSDKLLPLIKIFAIFKIGDGMCVHPTPSGHDNIFDAIVESYENDWTAQKQTIKNAFEYVSEYYDEAYEYGYAYADENGYIDLSVDAIDSAILALNGALAEVATLPLSAELRADLVNELLAAIDTLEELREVLATDSAKNVEGFVAAALGLEGDLYAHLNNIYAILEQGSIDLNQYVLIPALNEAFRLLTEEVLPAVDAAISAFVDSVIDYVVDILTPYYEKVVGVINVARETYELVVETIIRINLIVEGTVDFVEGAYDRIVNAYDKLITTLLTVYGTVDEAIAAACNIYNNVLNTIIEINARVEIAIENIENIIAAAVNAYDYTVNLLVKVYGSVENAVVVAGQIYDYVINIILENKALLELGIENATEFLAQLYADILKMIKAAPGQANDFADYMAAQLAAYVMGILNDLDAFIASEHDGALNGRYELKDDSFYLALGESVYAEGLAGLLNLSEKYEVVSLSEDYLEKIANADLITVKLDSNELSSFSSKQAAGIVADVIRGNEDVMEFYNNPLIGGYVGKVISDAGIDINAQKVDLDWNKYLDAETKAMLENALALLKAELIARGVPEYYYIDLQSMIDDVLEENGLLGLPGLPTDTDPIAIPVADIAVYALESALYAYATFTNDLATLLSNIYTLSPDATVVLVGVDNPLEGLNVDLGSFGIDCIDFDDCVAVTDALIQTFNVQLYMAALIDDNTIFAPGANVNAIYESLNVYCEHVYDSCIDPECNRCLAIREPGDHTFTNYIPNNDATCTQDGTKTAVCDFCSAEDTVVDEGSMLPHDYTEKTCTSPAKCKVCGATDGKLLPHDYEDATCTTARTCKVCGKTYGNVPGHKFTDWEETKEATYQHDGERKRTCTVCGEVETEVIPMILPKYSWGTIIAVVASAVLFASTMSALILWRLRKRDYLK